jgi:hypothetical protein
MKRASSWYKHRHLGVETRRNQEDAGLRVGIKGSKAPLVALYHAERAELDLSSTHRKLGY